MYKRLLAPRQRLIGSAFMMDMSLGCALLAVQLTGVMLGASPTVLGILGCLGGAVYTTMCLASGSLADRFPPRYTARAATFGLVLVWLGMAAAGRVEVLLGLVVASGATAAFFWPSLMVWVASLSSGGTRGLGRTLGLFNICWSGGLLTGAVVAGTLWDNYAQGSFYYSVGIGLLVLVLLHITPAGDNPESDAASAPSAGAGRAAVGRKLCILGRIGLAASFFSNTAVRALFPKLGEALGFSSSVVGWAAGMPFLSAMLIFAMARTTTVWQYRPWKLWLAVPSGVAGMVFATYARQPWQFLLGFGLVGICAGISYLASQFYGLDQPPEQRAASMRYHEAMVGIGGVSGPLLGGLIADYTGWLPAAFALCAGMLVMAGILQIIVSAVYRPDDR